VASAIVVPAAELLGWYLDGVDLQFLLAVTGRVVLGLLVCRSRRPVVLLRVTVRVSVCLAVWPG